MAILALIAAAAATAGSRVAVSVFVHTFVFPVSFSVWFLANEGGDIKLRIELFEEPALTQQAQGVVLGGVSIAGAGVVATSAGASNPNGATGAGVGSAVLDMGQVRLSVHVSS